MHPGQPSSSFETLSPGPRISITEEDPRPCSPRPKSQESGVKTQDSSSSPILRNSQCAMRNFAFPTKTKTAPKPRGPANCNQDYSNDLIFSSSVSSGISSILGRLVAPGPHGARYKAVHPLGRLDGITAWHWQDVAGFGQASLGTAVSTD
ncbi:hypothetical protein FIBSPDRAFT_967661 [Athelia psychrophila]|uniref:Uncharacterized protein n=1 Tax=Athelia psychrophila TaxID=1759441 RepID=A0A167VGN3_9AGAM|nr:hypothetical protein FIBSPDRAFT_967661 [Fibularhizoctonia sp. CBS 109695]